LYKGRRGLGTRPRRNLTRSRGTSGGETFARKQWDTPVTDVIHYEKEVDVFKNGAGSEERARDSTGPTTYHRQGVTFSSSIVGGG